MFTDVSWREEEEGGFTCTVPLLSGYFSNLQFSDGDTVSVFMKVFKDCVP